MICVLTDYVEEIFQTFMHASKDDLEKAAKVLKENTPEAMLHKQSKDEAIKKRDERKKMIAKDVPPTTPGKYTHFSLLSSFNSEHHH